MPDAGPDPSMMAPGRQLREAFGRLRRQLRFGGEARLQQQRNQASPAGLVRRTKTTTAVAVKIFVEQQIVAEMDVLLLEPRVPEHRSAAVFVAKKDPAQPLGKLISHFTEITQPARPDWTLYLEIVSVITVEPAQRFDDQKVHRHPDRAAPIRIATEHV